jgi:predicted O-methyltransferase YrrM
VTVARAPRGSHAIRRGLRLLVRGRRFPRPAVRLAGSCILDAVFDLTSPLPLISPPEAPSRFLLLPSPHQLAPGNQSIRGLAYLVAIAQAVGASRIFEFGTYNGLTALTLAANLREAMVDTLDLPPGTVPAFPLADSDVDHIGASNRIYPETPESSRITQHLADSARFDFSRFSGVFDLVYIDGAHSPDYVRSDTDHAFRIVKDDGVVIWDDYARLVPGVFEYLDAIRDLDLYRLTSSRLVAWFSPSALDRVGLKAGA